MITYLVADGVALLESFPPGSVSAVVTSPPYNLGLGRRTEKSSNWRVGRLANEGGYGRHKDDMPRDEYVKWQRKAIAAALNAVGYDGVAILAT